MSVRVFFCFIGLFLLSVSVCLFTYYLTLQTSYLTPSPPPTTSPPRTKFSKAPTNPSTNQNQPKSRIILLLLLVARSKLVPDFALTLHLIHLLATSCYSRSVPANWLWWALQAASAGLMVVGGVWSCRWRELRPIAFGKGGKEGGGGGGGAGGEYEMVAVEEGGEGEGEGRT